jgi:NADH dehydrogenase FAD-containing subunit
MTMASALDANIYAIGDSCVAGEMPLYGNPNAAFDMPKSAHIAMTQAKVAAAAIVAKLNGLPTPEPYYANTCYSVVGDDYGISVAHLYRVVNGTFKYIPEGSGVSMTTMPDKSPVPAIYRKLEAEYADGWLRNVIADAFG